MSTTVVNLHKEPYDVYIGRPGCGKTAAEAVFGNPFTPSPVHFPHAREVCVDKFRHYFLERVENDPEFRRRVLSLKGKRLGCFCKPLPCHGDVIAEWVDSHEK